MWRTDWFLHIGGPHNITFMPDPLCCVYKKGHLSPTLYPLSTPTGTPSTPPHTTTTNQPTNHVSRRPALRLEPGTGFSTFIGSSLGACGGLYLGGHITSASVNNYLLYCLQMYVYRWCKLTKYIYSSTVLEYNFDVFFFTVLEWVTIFKKKSGFI